MKKTLISLATASLIASSAMAADKGIDFTTTGQAVVYYQTNASNADGAVDIFNKDTSSANVGVQLNLAADLKNNFTFGSQFTYLGTDGLEKNLVNSIRETAGTTPTKPDTTSELALTKIFIAKQIANTTVKIGRQELPKSLSPLAFTEGWNVFKNTFDALVVINSDLPHTTLVGAYVGKSTGHTLGSTSDLTVASSAGSLTVAKTAYMLTAQNTALPMTTITGSYYALAGITSAESANALWLDAKVADKSLPMGLKVGIQAGMIMPEADITDDTTAMGMKASIKPMPALTVCGVFTYVSGSKDKAVAAVKNTGTGVKTPLFSQMVANQDAIALDNKTFMLKGAYSLGDMGTVIGQYGYTMGGQINLMNDGRSASGKVGVDYSEFDLMYKVKASGVQYLAALVNRSWSEKNAKNATEDKNLDNQQIIRVWARYAF